MASAQNLSRTLSNGTTRDCTPFLSLRTGVIQHAVLNVGNRIRSIRLQLERRLVIGAEPWRNVICHGRTSQNQEHQNKITHHSSPPRRSHNGVIVARLWLAEC